MCTGGGNAEFVAVHEDHVMIVPESMSLQNAAAIPEVWLTAYQLLHFVGQVKFIFTSLVWVVLSRARGVGSPVNPRSSGRTRPPGPLAH